MIPLMTSPEVRGYLKISPSTLRRLLERGMPYFGEGRLRRFERDSVLRWYSENT